MTNKEQVAKLLEAAAAVIQYSTVALYGNGYRPAKNRPGHHQTMIQSLVHSISLNNDERLLLDTFRVKRNAADYTGELLDDGSVVECIDAAVRLQQHLYSWLNENRPDPRLISALHNTRAPFRARIRQHKNNNNRDLALAPGVGCLYLKS
jgi:hypothetical protein